jgi:hypothetical protein
MLWFASVGMLLPNAAVLRAATPKRRLSLEGSTFKED